MYGEILHILEQFGAGGGGDPATTPCVSCSRCSSGSAWGWSRYSSTGGWGETRFVHRPGRRGQRHPGSGDVPARVRRLSRLVSGALLLPCIPAPGAHADRLRPGPAGLRLPAVLPPRKHVGRTYLRAGLGVFVALYLVTAPLWIRFLEEHAESISRVGPHFGLFWGDSPIASPLPCSSASSSRGWRAPVAGSGRSRHRCSQGSCSSFSTSF